MGCFDKAPAQTTQTVTPPKEYLAAYKDVLGKAQTAAAKPFQAYPGQGVAPLNATQQQGITGAQNLGGSAQEYIDQALGLINQSAGPIAGQFGGLTPEQLSAAGTQGFDWLNESTQDVDMPEFSAENIAKYTDPYLQDVIGQTLGWMQHSDAVDQNALRGNAVSAGAWGGDRAGVAQAELGRNQADARNKTIAGLQSQGYAQALAQLNMQQKLALEKGDAAAARKAAAASAALSSFFQGTGQNLSAKQSDAQRAGQAGQSIGNLGQMKFGQDLASIEEMMKAGGLEQTNAQAMNDYLRGQFEAEQQYPFNTIGWLSDISQGLGSKAGSTTTNSQAEGSGLSGIFGGLTSAFGLGDSMGLFDDMFGGSGSSAGSTIGKSARGGRVGYEDGGGIFDDLWAGPDRLPGRDDAMLMPAPQPQAASGGGGDLLNTVMKFLPMILSLKHGGRVGRDAGGAADFWSGPRAPGRAAGMPKRKDDDLLSTLTGQGGLGALLGLGAVNPKMLLGGLLGGMKDGGRAGYEDGGMLDDAWDTRDLDRTARELADRAARKRAALRALATDVAPPARHQFPPRNEPGLVGAEGVPWREMMAGLSDTGDALGQALSWLGGFDTEGAGPDLRGTDARIRKNALNNERLRLLLSKPVESADDPRLQFPHGNIPMSEEAGYIDRSGGMARGGGIRQYFAGGGGLDDEEDDAYVPPPPAPRNVAEVAPSGRRGDWWSRLASSPDLALILGGLNTMAGRSTHPLQNIGSGFSSGLQQAAAAKQALAKQDYDEQVARARQTMAEAQGVRTQDLARHRGVMEEENTRHHRAAETTAERMARESAARGDRQQKHWDDLDTHNSIAAERLALTEAGANVDRLAQALARMNDPLNMDVTAEEKAATSKAYSNAIRRYNTLTEAANAPPPAAAPPLSPSRTPTQVPNPVAARPKLNVGDVKFGKRYKGGNPRDPNNWVAVQPATVP